MSSSSVTITITPADVVTGVTATIVRTDTSQVVVTNAVLIFDGTDTWEYAFIDPAPNLTYSVTYTTSFTDGSTFNSTGTITGTTGTSEPVTAVLQAYTTVEEADTYLGNTIDYLIWLSTDTNTKVRALNTATRQIDNLKYKGDKTLSTQTFQFPRNGNLVVPTDIKDACVLLAGALVDGVSIEEEYNSQSVTAESYTNIKTTYSRESSNSEHILNGIPSILAWKKLKPYLADMRHCTHCRA